MNKLSNSKLLITGGAGFIGSNLIEHFLKQNNKVVCLDNLSTGFKKNIVPFMENKNFQFIEGDIRNLDVCKKATQGCDYVFHQAALGSVPRSIKDPATTNAVNIDGFLNMLIAAKDENIERFIYAPSSPFTTPSLPLTAPRLQLTVHSSLITDHIQCAHRLI